KGLDERAIMASQWPSHPWGRPPSRSCRRTSPLRPPPVAVSHHHGVFIPPLAGATAARGIGAPPGGSRYGRSAPPLSLASRPAPTAAVVGVWGCERWAEPLR